MKELRNYMYERGNVKVQNMRNQMLSFHDFGCTCTILFYCITFTGLRACYAKLEMWNSDILCSFHASNPFSVTMQYKNKTIDSPIISDQYEWHFPLTNVKSSN